jgi:hypothetical protein
MTKLQEEDAAAEYPRQHHRDHSGRNCMPGFTKIFVALGDTTTERLGFCFLLMSDFLSARLIRFLTQR